MISHYLITISNFIQESTLLTNFFIGHSFTPCLQYKRNGTSRGYSNKSLYCVKLLIVAVSSCSCFKNNRTLNENFEAVYNTDYLWKVLFGSKMACYHEVHVLRDLASIQGTLIQHPSCLSTYDKFCLHKYW